MCETDSPRSHILKSVVKNSLPVSILGQKILVKLATSANRTNDLLSKQLAEYSVNLFHSFQAICIYTATSFNKGCLILKKLSEFN